MEREIKTLLPTMKINAKKGEENDMPFCETTATIKELRDVDTKHGKKIVATVQDNDITFQVFINNVSTKNLIEAYGTNDENWIGQKVKIVKNDKNSFGQEMIVLEKA